MKKIILSIFLMVLGCSAFAQSPQRMNYQAVVRNATNVLVASSPVGMKISILQGTSSGTAVYVETHATNTNANGLATLSIGGGTVVSGTMAGINWANGPYFIKTETDPTGGTNYTIVATSQLMSVPYALFAANATTGATGATGAQGQVGATGTAGVNGINGVTGATGATGLQGAVGATGSTGATGANGTNGVAGATGAQGQAGATGATGLLGATGAQGQVGATGATGATGANGIVGATGAQGQVGATGATGAPGANGVVGATGAQGQVGATGATGANGLVGATGAQGQVGATGATGATGTNGIVGATGSQGQVGATGATGATGANGVVGATGAQGQVGATGATGATGSNGLVGSTGAQGQVGATGATGATGANGIIGATGAQGQVGATGATGLVGVTGAQGQVGATGATGSTGANGLVGATGATGDSGSNGINGTNGATGATGSQGLAGVTGATGATGAVGATGPGSVNGTTGYFPRFISSTALGNPNSFMQENASGLIGVNITPSSLYRFYVYNQQPTVNGDGQATLYGHRTRNSQNDGTAYSFNGANDGVRGMNFWGDDFTFGVSGFNYNDFFRTGGVLGAEQAGAYWGSLGYKNSAGTTFGVYGSNAFSSGTGFAANNVDGGVGGGFFGMVGSMSRGSVVGQFNTGELFSSYNMGDVYTAGRNVELVDTGSKMAPAYTMTSTEQVVYKKGKASLQNGIATIVFDADYALMLGDSPIVTITPMGECNGVYIADVSKNGFTVRELNKGTSNISISWIAVGDRVDAAAKKVPDFVTEKAFNESLDKAMFNDGNTKQSAEGMWWDGQRFQFNKNFPSELNPTREEKIRRSEAQSKK